MSSFAHETHSHFQSSVKTPRKNTVEHSNYSKDPLQTTTAPSGVPPTEPARPDDKLPDKSTPRLKRALSRMLRSLRFSIFFGVSITQQNLTVTYTGAPPFSPASTSTNCSHSPSAATSEQPPPYTDTKEGPAPWSDAPSAPSQMMGNPGLPVMMSAAQSPQEAMAVLQAQQQRWYADQVARMQRDPEASRWQFSGS